MRFLQRKDPFRNDPFFRSRWIDIVRSEKSQNKSSPIFSNFRPEFCSESRSEFPPNFLRSFRASFRGKRRPKSPPFFNAKFPGKFEEKIHKSFLESGQSNISYGFRNGRHCYLKPHLAIGACVSWPLSSKLGCKPKVSYVNTRYSKKVLVGEKLVCVSNACGLVLSPRDAQN